MRLELSGGVQVYGESTCGNEFRSLVYYCVSIFIFMPSLVIHKVAKGPPLCLWGPRASAHWAHGLCYPALCLNQFEFIFLMSIIQIYSGITRGRVLNGELYTQRLRN